MVIKSENLAYWFLRLNGFLTIQNFVVHPDEGANQRTDIDLLGIRFPRREELQINPMEDFSFFTQFGRPLIVITEVKSGRCKLNGPWTNKDDKNMQRVLKALGAFSKNKIDIVANNIYRNGIFKDRNFYVRLLSIGNKINENLTNEYPNVKQIVFDDILDFIYDRFKKYEMQKSSHPQWDETGTLLWNTSKDKNNVDEFISHFQIT